MVLEHRLRMLGVGAVVLLTVVAFAFAMVGPVQGANVDGDQQASYTQQQATPTPTPRPADTGSGGLAGQSGLALSLGLAGLALVGGAVAAGRFATRQR